MRVARRAVVAAAAALPALSASGVLLATAPDLAGLRNIAAGTAPIGPAERRQRIARAQALMRADGIGTVLVESGSSLVHFTDVSIAASARPRRSCRFRAIPASSRHSSKNPRCARRSACPAEVRVWPEDESSPVLAAVLPHGQIVLIDCSCTVQGCQSDVSRTFVFACRARSSAP